MQKKITLLLFMLFLSFVVASCNSTKNISHSVPGKAAQCRSIMHEIQFIKMHKHDWTPQRLHTRQRELWHQYKDLDCY